MVAAAHYVQTQIPRDVYVITTAKKRDSLDWNREFARFAVGTTSDATIAGVLRVDSWNNIHKYQDIKDAFFIFDEQRLVGSGGWVRSFLRIARNNNWILLSATPGDSWLDYIPVFIANGFVKNRTEFKAMHVIYKAYTKFPSVDRYVNVGRLVRWRNQILVKMAYDRHTTRHMVQIPVDHDREMMKLAMKSRWNSFTNRPIRASVELYNVMRRVVNIHPGRLGELNKHQEIPDSERWVYLVQYTAGAEGWECIETNATFCYSQNPSYKQTEQAYGRMDRLNTEFVNLFYYIPMSSAWIDKAMRRAFQEKRDFNLSDLSVSF